MDTKLEAMRCYETREPGTPLSHHTRLQGGREMYIGGGLLALILVVIIIILIF